jgi:hypothetical protein
MHEFDWGNYFEAIKEKQEKESNGVVTDTI